MYNAIDEWMISSLFVRLAFYISHDILHIFNISCLLCLFVFYRVFIVVATCKRDALHEIDSEWAIEARTVNDDNQYSTGLSAKAKTTSVEAGVCPSDAVLNQCAVEQIAALVRRPLVNRVRSIGVAAVDGLVAQLVVGDLTWGSAVCRLGLGPAYFRLSAQRPLALDVNLSHPLNTRQSEVVARPQVQLASPWVYYTACNTPHNITPMYIQRRTATLAD